MHLNIKEKKERINDVMAIYIVNPTDENLKIIKNDIEKSTYDNFFINFVEKSNENKLQNFFSDLIQTDKFNRIYKIMVHPLGYNLFHPRVFSLNIPNAYSILNSPNIKDEEINNYFERIGNGLFNMLFTNRIIPIIKYRTGFADSIVKTIQKNFYDTFEKFPELKEEFYKKNQTLLTIVDRDLDLPIMFHHAPSLGAMINDVFGITRSKTNKESIFEIDPLIDYVWNNYLGMRFVSAKEKIIEDLKHINQQTAFLDGNNADKKRSNDLEKMSEQIASTLEDLREITVKQKCLNNHAKFQERLTKEIDNRNIGAFFKLEEELLGSRTLNRETKKKFFELLTLKNITVKDINVHKSDILRLAIIYYLINTNISNEEVKEIENSLKNFNISLKAFEYFKQKRCFEESMKRGANANNQELSFLQKSVSYLRKYISTEQTSIIADTVNNLAINKEVKEYVCYNLLKKGIDKTINSSFNQVIVFTIGGGSLGELEYVEEYMGQNDRTVIISFSKIIFILLFLLK
jgi:hypothetical protein